MLIAEERIFHKTGWEKGREHRLSGALRESCPMLVRVSGSWELMEPTGSMANFSWNHLSGLANLSLTPWPPHSLSSLPLSSSLLPLLLRYVHIAWRYQEVTGGTEGYFVHSWLRVHRVFITFLLNAEAFLTQRHGHGISSLALFLSWSSSQCTNALIVYSIKFNLSVRAI